MKNLLAVFILVFATTTINAQTQETIELKTQDGRIIILKPNGTWELKKTDPQPSSTSTNSTKKATELANSLPTDFKGEDPNFIFDQLLELKGKLIKNEFESTAEFEKRSSEELRRPIASNLGLKDTFAFVANAVEAKYNADSKVMSLSLNIGENTLDTKDTNLYTIEWIHINYEKGTSDVYELLFDKLGSPFPPNINISRLGFSVNIPLEVEEAKRLKTSIEAIVFVKLKNPYAKPGKLKSDSYRRRRFYVSLVDIYLYDPQSGKVFAKASEIKK